MRNKQRVGPWVVCLAGILMSASGGAVTVASASISDLKFELIDLNVADGVTPSLTWISTDSSVDATHQFGQVASFFPQPGGSLQWSVSFAGSQSDTQQSSVGFLQPLNASQSGASSVIGSAQVVAQTSAVAGRSTSAFADASGSFLLSASTELRVTGTVLTSISGPGSSGFVNPAGVAPEIGVPFSQASSYAEVFLDTGSSLSNLSGGNYTPNTDHSTYSVDAYGDSGQLPVDLSLRNEGAGEMSGNFYALAMASATEITSPVPEPSEWVLMAAGLIAVALTSRNRRLAVRVGT